MTSSENLTLTLQRPFIGTSPREAAGGEKGSRLCPTPSRAGKIETFPALEWSASKSRGKAGQGFLDTSLLIFTTLPLSIESKATWLPAVVRPCASVC